ncbi:MAG: 2-C-methyl-D-erythritol 4-phosphate cytidylyltransferase [Oscillospiraceae bacterium]|nr:2-C-methyl-D-erythritol 4-phosphate cytidylyltransferase [Oscillospiraceae bacterium]
MKKVAVIFAGGVGQRMTNSTKPKQFLEVNGKPILVYTLEKFQTHPDIDHVVLVCVRDWIDYAKMLIRRYELTKVETVIPGGSNGHQSRYLGLKKTRDLYGDCMVLIHDGVRPLIDHKTITDCIESVETKGSAVVGTSSTETIAVVKSDSECKIIPREQCVLLRAPQCFRLGEIIRLFDQAEEEGIVDCIDAATLMQYYQKNIIIINGPPENIKITTPLDFFVFKGILEIQNSKEVFGL